MTDFKKIVKFKEKIKFYYSLKIPREKPYLKACDSIDFQKNTYRTLVTLVINLAQTE